MIDREQLDLIKVDRFFKRLHEAEAELAVFFDDCAAINLDVLGRARDVALVRADPVSNDARAEHVADELVMMAIPDEERGTGAAAAIDLEIFLLAVASDFDFILNHAGGPDHAHDVGLFRVAKSDDDVGGVLSEIAGRSGDFKFLAVAGGEDFDLGADGALVIVEAFQGEPQPVVLVSTLVAQAGSRGHDSA